MEPSHWKQVEFIDRAETPGTYALTDALFHFRDKFEREMIACDMATGPITCVLATENPLEPAVSSELNEHLLSALNVVWPDAVMIGKAINASDPLAMPSLAGDLKAGHLVQLQISQAKCSQINLIDENFRLFQLYRLVTREELHLFTRVINKSGQTVFVDEFSVSSTILVDTLISPVGGFIIRLEKNTSRPLVVDFGPVIEGGEHILRFNDAFRQPSATPPLVDVESSEPIIHNHNH